MIKHLKVLERNAQDARVFLEKSNALNDAFLPIKKEGHILWPLNFEVKGEIVVCEGVKSKRNSRDYRQLLPSEIRSLAPRSFDMFGDIGIIKFPDECLEYSEIIAKALLESHSNLKKVAIDKGVKGEYRIRQLQMITGEPDFVSLHRENGFEFKLDISKVYFSPRLSMERRRIHGMVKSSEKVLDAFAGVCPFSISLASKGCKITAVDSNPDSEFWAHENFRRNKIAKSSYDFFCSKIEDILPKLKLYDRIIMNSPTTSLNYLQSISNKLDFGGFIHLYTIIDNDVNLNIGDYLPPNFNCVFERVVHPYSPSSSLVVFDIVKAKNNVQRTNQ